MASGKLVKALLTRVTRVKIRARTGRFPAQRPQLLKIGRIRALMQSGIAIRLRALVTTGFDVAVGGGGFGIFST
jgi:hypothetical protein